LGNWPTSQRPSFLLASRIRRSLTVREYDRFGYAGQDIQYTALEAAAVTQLSGVNPAAGKEKRRAIFKRCSNAVVSTRFGDVWMGVSNDLYRSIKKAPVAETTSSTHRKVPAWK